MLNMRRFFFGLVYTSILTYLNANDVNVISIDRQKLDFFKRCILSILVEFTVGQVDLYVPM